MVRGIGKRHGEGISRLNLHFVKVHRRRVYPGRRAGLEPPQGQAQLQEGIRQPQCGVHAVGAGVLHALADDGSARQIGSGGQNDGFDVEYRSGGQHHGGNGTVFRADLHHLALADSQMCLPLQRVLHPFLVFPAVRLGPQGPDGGAFALVQQPVLDAALVGSFCHLAAQGVQLPDQMALAGAADGGVAGHIAHGVQIDGKYHRLQPQPGGGQRRLDARVPGADDGDIKLSGVKFSHIKSSFMKGQHRHLRAVEQAESGAGIAQTPGDEQAGAVFFIQPRRVGWEKGPLHG